MECARGSDPADTQKERSLFHQYGTGVGHQVASDLTGRVTIVVSY
jgi:hypothetical protein